MDTGARKCRAVEVRSKTLKSVLYVRGSQCSEASTGVIYSYFDAGHDQTVSARIARQKLQKHGYYSRAAVHKPLITKTNAHLRAQWYKNHRHWSIEMWKK